MKTNKLFKILIDGLFVSQLVYILGIFFIIPTGVLKINKHNSPVQEWSFVHWIILIFSIISYICFILALFQLRKVAGHLLKNKYFTTSIINSLKKSGNEFIYSGTISFSIIVISFFNRLFDKTFQLTFDSDLMFCLFITSIGLFLLIQSKAMLSAKEIKQENDLTI